MTFHAATFLMFSTVSLAQSKPDLSGIWEMNKNKSVSSGTRTAMWMAVEQIPDSLNVTMRSFEGAKEEKYSFKYGLGSEPSSNNLHGARMVSHLTWEGDTLVITSLAMYGSQPLNMTERWSVNGDVLTMRIVTQFDKEPARNSVDVLERRTRAQWPPEGTKAAEEVYKNIRVLKGFPASSITVTMTQYTKDLGVTCAFCHSGSDMDRDDRVTKQTARRMIEMTKRINAGDFDGHNLVTCGTCHRGSAKPSQ